MNAAHSDALVFFCATADLASKKIFPALRAMVKRGHWDVLVIGVATGGVRPGLHPDTPLSSCEEKRERYLCWAVLIRNFAGACIRCNVQKECTPVCSPFARLLQCGRAWTVSPHTQEEKRKQAHERRSNYESGHVRTSN